MKKGDLKTIAIKNFTATRSYYLATKKGASLSSLARNFLDSILASV
jgi:hypothetical protein